MFPINTPTASLLPRQIALYSPPRNRYWTKLFLIPDHIILASELP